MKHTIIYIKNRNACGNSKMLRKCLRTASSEQYYSTINSITIFDMTWIRNSACQMFISVIRRQNKIAYFFTGDVKEDVLLFFKYVMMNIAIFNGIWNQFYKYK